MGRATIGIFKRAASGQNGFVKLDTAVQDVMESGDDMYATLTKTIIQYQKRADQTHTIGGFEYPRYGHTDEDDRIVEALKDCQRRFFFLNRMLERVKP